MNRIQALADPFQDSFLSSFRFFISLMIMGFVSGLPFILTLSTLSIWLSELGFNIKTIGAFTVISLPYAFKFLWAPFIDKFEIPFLTFLPPVKRFGLLALVCLFLSLVVLSNINPEKNLLLLAFVCSLVSFFAATHDIVLDTLRIYASDKKTIGGGAASEAIGFRLGMITSGAGAVYLSVYIGWSGAYLTMAFLCLFGIVGLLYLPNHTLSYSKPKNNGNLFSETLKTLVEIPNFYYIVCFIFFVKISGTVMNALGAPFLLDIGFSKLEYASISKVYGTGLMIAGSFLGAVIIVKKDSFSCLTISIFMQTIACILFALLSYLHSAQLYLLIFTLSIESLSNGLLATSLISYISTFCKQPNVASHFTLLYSIGSMSRVASSVVGGYIADYMGWTFLFLFSAITFVPSFICLTKLKSKVLS